MSDELVREVMKASNGAAAAAVMEFLRLKRQERGGRYAAGGRCGPRSGAWFVEVVKAHFSPAKVPALPPEYRLEPEVFDRMTGALDGQGP